MRDKSLPIWRVEPAIVEALRAGNRLVLAAPTGSGKSTQVPQMLRDQLGIRKIVVLQPRRVAARTLAARVAAERQVRLGGEVGYQIRFEDVTSLGTQISFVTEGILLRWLQDDPSLSDIGALVFDEFHERNLLSDVALGLVKALQKRQRPDLKVVVMSATLDTQSVAQYLEGCPVIVSEGTLFAVEVAYLPPGENYSPAQLTRLAAEAVGEVIQAGEAGDILVFMPGMAEIQAAIAECRHLRLSERITLLPLHGELPPEEQDRAFESGPGRKVVVATNVAETSVTIPGVRHVIDSGLARVARYDSDRGLGTLLIEEISRASADQRKGRAGRTAPGTCRRLWSESNHLNRPERNTPEIQRSDLAEVVLLLHSLGVREAARFDWLDRPEPAAVHRAESLLQTLGALAAVPAAGSDLTPIGRQMLRLPMHPRYSRMLVEAARLGCAPEAALCAALVSGRDLLRRLGRDDQHISQAREEFERDDRSDFFPLIEAFRFAESNRFDDQACYRRGINAQSARQVAMTWRQICDIARVPSGELPRSLPNPEALLRCLLAGFVDQLCVRKDQGTLDCLMTEGRTGTLMRESVVQKSPLLVVSVMREVSGKAGLVTLLGLATMARVEWLRALFPDQLSEQSEHIYDRTHKRVAALRLLRFRDLVIAQEHQKELDPRASGRVLAEAHLAGHFELPLFNHDLKQFVARVNLVAHSWPELDFPPFSPAALLEVLARAFAGLSLAKEAQAAELRRALQAHLAPEQVSWLDELAPAALLWHGEKKQKLLYLESAPGQPVAPELQVKLHECFGRADHPKICEGRLPVNLWLCAPDGKRVQSTQDWPKFRAEAYPKLKPSLQKKYPGFTWL